MKKITVVCLLLSLILLLMGCSDIEDRFRPAAFGGTDEENAMVKTLIEKYGDLRATGGEPRFLEAMVTSRVENYIPVDTVLKYTQDTKELYVWFVYDNFNNDKVEIEWIYLDDNYSIHTFQSQTGENFGRGIFVLEEPDGGWPIGNYEVLIRGRGVEVSVPFEIITGSTEATALNVENGRIIFPIKAGWYLVREEPVMSSNDVTIAGGIPQRQAGVAGTMYDYHEGVINKNEFIYGIRRTEEDGSIIFAGTPREARGSKNIKWTDPPQFIAAEQKVTLTIDRTVGALSWGVRTMSAGFYPIDVSPGQTSHGSPRFVTPEGRTAIRDSYNGTFVMDKGANPGTEQEKERAVLIDLGQRYGYRYIYQWRE